RRLSAARNAGQGAQDAAGRHTLHPRGGRRLLRPQWRRRRCARRRAAGARRRRTPGARAMDAGRRIHVGAVRAGHDHAGQGRGREQAHRRLELRRLEPEPQHAAGRPGRHQPARSWYMAEPHQPGPARQAAQPNGAGDRNAIPRYDLPRHKVTHHLIIDNPIRTSALRTLGAYANVFAIESFMDELAAAAAVDPIEFRLAHSKDPRERAVIEAVAKAANWTSGEKGNGSRGRRIGYAKYKNTAAHSAVSVEREVDRASGTVKVPRAWTAVDSGLIINPDGLANQIEGGIVQSTSWTLYEHVRFDKTGIQSRDWRSYPILSIADTPKIETVLINRPTERALGAGEASQGPAVAAIANAFAAATGKRIRELPFTPERVKAALA